MSSLFSAATAVAALCVSVSILRSAPAIVYAGVPYRDAHYTGGAQAIPGPVFCAYYDLGGEGVAYHDTDSENQGSGKLNPANGTYLNEFRQHEGVDISYTKPVNDRESPCNRVVPPPGLLYVGWTDPGEWFKITINVSKAGTYVADVLYTSHEGGEIGIALDGAPQATSFSLASTFDPAETIPWRQWHHWNVSRDAFEITLPAGVHVLQVSILTRGQLNLATFHFRPKGTARPSADVTTFCTALPKL